MNEDLQKQLAEMLAKLMDATQNAATWTADQIPLLVQEKILFGRIWETVLLVLLVAFTVLLVKVAGVAWGHQWDGDRLSATMLYLASTGAATGCVVQAYFVTLVWFAPRLYILEWLRTFTQ